MNLVMTAGARQDLSETIDWYEKQEPGLGSEFLAAIEQAFHTIMESPRTYPIDEDGPEGFQTRICLVPRFRYRIVYALSQDDILIAAIDRGRRRPGYWHSRLSEID